jgi:hypothetical protein
MEKIHKPVKAPAPTSDEMYDALHAVVISAEADGRRDNPGVAAAREILQRHPKHPPPVVEPAPDQPEDVRRSEARARAGRQAD